MKTLPTLCITSSIALLSACTTSNTSPGPTPNTYETLLSDAATTSPITARLREWPSAPLTNNGTKSTGTLTHDTNAFSLGPLTDSDGPDNNGDLADDTNPLVAGTIIQQEVGNTYSYVQPIEIREGPTFPAPRFRGYAGIATLAADMPTSGMAVFTGEAGGNAPQEDWEKEPATLTADFGAGTVAIASSNTTAGGVLIDLNITGAAITAGTFTGGTLVATADGVPIDVSSEVAPIIDGDFFGYNEADSVPGDVGAFVSSDGVDGRFDLTILGTSIAPDTSGSEPDA